MTDASFASRMDSAPVTDLVAPPRRVRERVVNDFQAAMTLRPKTYNVRWWTAQRIAAGCLIGWAAVHMLVVVARKVVRAMGAG